MIALHVWWGAGSGPPPDSLSASLGIANGGAAASIRSENAVLASKVARAADVRSWRPARLPNGGYLLFNGYIDNRAELRNALSLPESSDQTLYAAALAQWGDAVDLKIIGQYCTIMLAADGQSVRLARSPINAPPLHIWSDASQLIVASTPRVIFATGEVKQKIDEQKIADSLYLNYNEEERSWFEGVHRLPIATRGWINREGMKTSRYYDLAALPRIKMARDEDYVEAANALFAEGTRAALQGFSRPAISISGGLDSQAVAAHALKIMPAGSILRGYTGVPEAGWVEPEGTGFFCNERPSVEAFAAMYPNFVPEWVDAAGLSFDHKLREIFLLAGGSPRNTMNLHWIHEVHSRAKTSGCDVILGGDVGNISFSVDGDWVLFDWLRQGRWIKLIRELNMGRRNGRSLVHDFIARVGLPMLPFPIWSFLVKLTGREPDQPLESWCPINPDWAREMNVDLRSTAFEAQMTLRSPTNGRNRVTALNGGEHGDIYQAFEELHGIPHRDPTAYRPLVEFCFGIPDDQYVMNGQTRSLARRMLKGMVPEIVRNEPRRGIQAADWHLRINRQRVELGQELDRLAQDPVMAKRLDLPRLKAALEDWRPETEMDSRQIETLEVALPRALTTARFIRFVEGRND